MPESAGVAGDQEITGLTSGVYYLVRVGGAGGTVYPVLSNGTLGTPSDSSQALTGTKITGLVNGQLYEVYTTN